MHWVCYPGRARDLSPATTLILQRECLRVVDHHVHRPGRFDLHSICKGDLVSGWLLELSLGFSYEDIVHKEIHI